MPTLTRSSNGTTNGSSINVMSLRTSVLDSLGASSSTVTSPWQPSNFSEHRLRNTCQLITHTQIKRSTDKCGVGWSHCGEHQRDPFSCLYRSPACDRRTDRQTQRTPHNSSCSTIHFTSWLRGLVVERRSLADELSLSCARPVANGWPLMWVNRPL